MRNLKLFATVLFVAVLLVGVVILLRPTSTQNDTSVTTTQVANQQLVASNSISIDPPKKRVRVGNTPLFMDANKKVVRTPLKAKSSAINNQTSNKIQGKSKRKVIQKQSNK